MTFLISQVPSLREDIVEHCFSLVILCYSASSFFFLSSSHSASSPSASSSFFSCFFWNEHHYTLHKKCNSQIIADVSFRPSWIDGERVNYLVTITPSRPASRELTSIYIKWKEHDFLSTPFKKMFFKHVQKSNQISKAKRKTTWTSDNLTAKPPHPAPRPKGPKDGPGASHPGTPPGEKARNSRSGGNQPQPTPTDSNQPQQ